jgi:hypothetical protein
MQNNLNYHYKTCFLNKTYYLNTSNWVGPVEAEAFTVTKICKKLKCTEAVK